MLVISTNQEVQRGPDMRVVDRRTGCFEKPDLDTLTSLTDLDS